MSVRCFERGVQKVKECSLAQSWQLQTAQYPLGVPGPASHNTDVWADAIWGSENKTECGGAVQGIQSGDPRIQEENRK